MWEAELALKHARQPEAAEALEYQNWRIWLMLGGFVAILAGQSST